MKSGKYVIAQGDQTEEDERLRLLVSLLDPATHEYLMEAGIGPGWRCLEVGAGSGTVASWMADQVGDDGRIVAVDIDTSRLASLAGRGVEVRQHDVTSRPVEHGSFDLVHARAVLMHVADPMQALKNMVAGIAPGGWLVVSDADFATWRCVTRAHPHAAMFDEVSRSMWDALDERGVMSSYLASEHIDLFDQLDVEDVQSFGRYDVVRGGSPGRGSGNSR